MTLPIATPLVVGLVALFAVASAGVASAADPATAAPQASPPAAPPQVALVGCAHIHTPGFVQILKKRADVKVKCVWDHDAERAKKWAAELGAPVVQDVSAIWSDPQIKAVVICSETDRHEQLIVAAAKAGKHIYAEKPLGMGAKDAYAAAKAIEEAGVLFETGYFMRGDPKIQFLREQLAKGAFGKVTRVRGSNCHSGALEGWFDTDWRWMADPKVAGIGAFGDLGTHSLDLLLLLTGNVTKTTAALSAGTARYPGCDEGGEGMLLFENGTLGSLAAGWDDVANPVTLEISGTEGHATIIEGNLYFQSKHVQGADGKQPWKQLPPQWPAPLEMFLDAVNGKKDVPLVTAAEAAYRSAVMEAMYQAAQSPDGPKWLNVPKEPAGAPRSRK